MRYGNRSAASCAQRSVMVCPELILGHNTYILALGSAQPELSARLQFRRRLLSFSQLCSHVLLKVCKWHGTPLLVQRKSLLCD